MIASGDGARSSIFPKLDFNSVPERCSTRGYSQESQRACLPRPRAHPFSLLHPRLLHRRRSRLLRSLHDIVNSCVYVLYEDVTHSLHLGMRR
jgi:hypothetical protein